MLVSVLAECLLIPFWPSGIQHTQTTTHVNKLRSTERKTQLNVHPISCHEGIDGEKMYGSTLSLTLALYGVGLLRHIPAILLLVNDPVGWVGSRSSLDRRGKSRPQLDSIPWTAQPVESRYTD